MAIDTAKQFYLDLQGLQQYDALIKSYIGAEDAKSIKSATIVNDVIRLYKVENPTDADAYIPLDLSDYLHKVKNATAGHVVTVNADGTVADGGTALADLALKTEVGSLSELKTTAKDSAVVAINELKDTLDQADKDHKVALTVTTDPAEGVLKTYTITQGEGENAVEVGKIDIPKDLVVTEGSIVENPDAEHQGTFIKLVIANQEAPLYINVKDLIDIYTAQQNATQVQLAVSSTNELSATIVEKSINTKELADAAVTTVKIADGNVTRAKISKEFEDQIKALEDAIGEGGSVGTQIDNKINALDADVTSAAPAEAGKGLQVQVVETDGKVTSVVVSGDYSKTYDALGSAGTAEKNAKDYADDLDEAMDLRVDSLEEKVGEGFGTITEAEISALFPTL